MTGPGAGRLETPAGSAFRLAALLVATALAACGGREGDAAPGRAGVEDAAAGAPTAHNTLTAEERAAGWELLFDGESLDDWRGYGRDDLPEIWVTEGGEMTLRTEGGEMGGGDIVTVEEFTDFELVFDFKVGPGGNSGVFYRVREVEGKSLWQVAPEYQVLDDPAYPATDGWSPPKHRTGENYDLHEADDRVVHPMGAWNTGRIVADGSHVEHWLNGRKTAHYELYSPGWEALVADSKYATEEHYARAPSGHIALQEHGTPVWYRNIKIRRLGRE